VVEEPGGLPRRSTNSKAGLLRSPRADKSGKWNSRYDWAVPVADDLYDAYLAELRDEALI
jgi:hypothetical protein